MSVFFIPLLNENFKKSSTVLLSEKLVLFGKLLVPSELLKNGARSAGYVHQTMLVQHHPAFSSIIVQDGVGSE